ncbi:Zinc finger protein GLIS2 homolog [Eumeta japonica]|uniref:Zinc finger protein GLIS2 homolog n=1 Tax=Eumeta variegata TaxID=151549 RepID=A0A4C1VTW3_EUMVA|nr:Zinc finger protein GLIS2 homolog [Eumeta japonica]
MLMYPQWPTEVELEGCRAARWAPSSRFAPYLARPLLLRRSPPPVPLQVDSESSGSSSPKREITSEAVCDWTGCGARFAGVSRLSAHVARVHAHSHHDGLFYCGWRGCTRPHRGFNARYKMLVHVRTHTNERPHACPHCFKSFSRAENLKIHLRSHSGEKPYVCPFEGCGKAYSNSSDRFKHTRTHTVDKPYCCKVPGCNKRYTDPSSLRKHVKTYKHFTPKHIERDSSSEDTISAPGSPQNAPSPQHTSVYTADITNTPLNPAKPSLSPISREVSPIAIVNPVNAYPQLAYLRPLVEPPRIPQYEMSYSEYIQMYEQAYRIYYTNGVSIPAVTPPGCEAIYSYKSPGYHNDDGNASYPKSVHSPECQHVDQDDNDLPLNLKCTNTEIDSSAFQIMKHIDSPLDLSIKS